MHNTCYGNPEGFATHSLRAIVLNEGGVHVTRGKLEYRHPGAQALCDAWGRDWCVKLRTDRNYWKLQEISTPESLEKAQPCQKLHFF